MTNGLVLSDLSPPRTLFRLVTVKLSFWGGRHRLLCHYPHLGDTPWFRYLSPVAQTTASLTSSRRPMSKTSSAEPRTDYDVLVLVNMLQGQQLALLYHVLKSVPFHLYLVSHYVLGQVRLEGCNDPPSFATKQTYFYRHPLDVYVTV